MLPADQLHKQALRFACAGNRAAKRGHIAKAKGWWRFAAKKAEQSGDQELATGLWQRAGNLDSAKKCS